MLEEYKHSYEAKADAYITDDWRKMNKNELFFRYCKYEESNPRLAEAYLAAVTVRYWNLINSYYLQGKGAYEVEDCYYWLVHVLTWAVKQKPWEKGGSMEGDPNGPDKYINVCMKSRRQGFYQWSNAKKRADSFTQTTSLNRLMEETGDAKLPIIEDVALLDEYIDIKNLVVKEFNDKNYMSSFIIDGIVNTPVIDTVKEKGDPYIYTQFNKKKLSRHIRSMSDDYCKTFSNMYDLPDKEVLSARDTCSSMSSNRIYTLMNNTLTKLSKNSLFKKV